MRRACVKRGILAPMSEPEAPKAKMGRPAYPESRRRGSFTIASPPKSGPCWTPPRGEKTKSVTQWARDVLLGAASR